VLYLFSPRNFRNYLLLIASLFFYAWGEMQYIFVLLVSIIANYFFGILIGSSNQGEKKLITKNAALFGAVTINLVLLGYFKYANFFVDNLNGFLALFSSDLKISIDKVHLPIGISFFTFHSISYIVDIYRGKVVPQKNIFDLALYISLFPQLVAGPIVRYNTINKQLDVKKRRHHPLFVAYGIRRFIIGLGKKVIIANPLGEIADNIFALPADQLSSNLAWIGIICYSLQIFFDFSGYSDMAIGLARIFGFKFLENFNYPYIAKSIREFWQRWHISLSSWFRDYLYIPLGGNRCSVPRQYFNLVLVFLLCGFWHGASWNFIFWGLFHGCFLVLERTKFGAIIAGQKVISHFYALLVVMVGWVFFRSADLPYSIAYLKAMFVNFNFPALPSNIATLVHGHFNLSAFAIALLLSMPIFSRHGKLFLFHKFCFKSNSAKIWVSLLKDSWLIAIFILAIIRLAAGTHNPFIYFQF
jgi:alginate O-acetyltransferase complex protein AlgI